MDVKRRGLLLAAASVAALAGRQARADSKEIPLASAFRFGPSAATGITTQRTRTRWS
jgi:hypothetical protein